MKRLLTILLLIPLSIFAQELNCRISINYTQVKNANVEIFQNLQKDLMEFMNTTKWTKYIFSNIERIDCSMLLTIESFNGVDEFKGSLQVSSTRPIYMTTLNSPIFSFKDKNIEFKYVENQPLNFNENTYTDELTSLMAFYAYIILGYDFDTFSRFGGDEFFQKAQKIVDNAQISPNNGWKAIGSMKEDNRYYLAKNLNSELYKPYREAFYLYHRLGMDMMTQDITTGRKNVVLALQKIKQVYQKKPDSYLIQLFVQTKKDEIMNIFSEAPMQQAREVAQIMKIIDPTNADLYNKLGQVNRQP